MSAGEPPLSRRPVNARWIAWLLAGIVLGVTTGFLLGLTRPRPLPSAAAAGGDS